MLISLPLEEKHYLEREHRTTRDGRVRDRIKAVLLSSEGWSIRQIGQALRIHEETVRTHLEDYQNSKKLAPGNGGSKSLLNEAQTQAMIAHLEEKTYACVKDICAYVFHAYGIKYTVQGMTNRLHAWGFSYKKPKGTPLKADMAKQEAFIAFYEKLLKTTSEDEPILFTDGVHPTMATKISYGWIKKGVDKPLATTASRTRLNLMGSLNLETMKVTINSFETLDSRAMEKHFLSLKQAYPNALKIHLILDRGPYNISIRTRESALKMGICLHHLPPYSPNLNPIERLWKVMNEHVRNNRFFTSPSQFKEAILNFFKFTWPQISKLMVDRIHDTFQTLVPVPSS